MAKLGKRTTAARAKVDPTKVYKVTDAVKIVKGNAKAKFDETIEIAVNLGVDPEAGGPERPRRREPAGRHRPHGPRRRVRPRQEG